MAEFSPQWGTEQGKSQKGTREFYRRTYQEGSCLGSGYGIEEDEEEIPELGADI